MDTPINARSPATQNNPWVELTVQLRAECFFGQAVARDYQFGMSRADFHSVMWLLMNQIEDMTLQVIDLAATESPEDQEEDLEDEQE